jgi:hypothetical protein
MKNALRFLALAAFLSLVATQAQAYEAYYVAIKKTDQAPADLNERIQQVGVNNCKPGSATNVDTLVVVLQTVCDTQVDFFFALSQVAAVKGVDRVMSITFDPPIKK